MKLRVLYLALLALSYDTLAQNQSLQSIVEKAARPAKGKVGVAVYYSGNKSTVSVNGGDYFPMQSVYKFPLALAVLHKLSKDHQPLDTKLHVAKEDLLPDTHSPLRDKYPDGNIDLTMEELIRYTVGQSDNNGCDILFRYIGGTKKAEDYIHSLGVNEIAIKATEQEMHKSWDVQFTNKATPHAITLLFEKFITKNFLSGTDKDFLRSVMEKTTTGLKRIKGQLPPGTTVMHKTGTSGTNEQGILAAVNDAGVVMLPDGEYFIITVFITNSPASLNENEEVIARISKAVWDYYVND